MYQKTNVSNVLSKISGVKRDENFEDIGETFLTVRHRRVSRREMMRLQAYPFRCV